MPPPPPVRLRPPPPPPAVRDAYPRVLRAYEERLAWRLRLDWKDLVEKRELAQRAWNLLLAGVPLPERRVEDLLETLSVYRDGRHDASEEDEAVREYREEVWTRLRAAKSAAPGA